MNAMAVLPLLLLTQASYFDMQGTITGVESPESLLVGNTAVTLAEVDSSVLRAGEYAYLMRDLRSWLLGKDVFVKDGYVYFDLTGSYNSISINYMIQKEIYDLMEESCCRCYGYSC